MYYTLIWAVIETAAAINGWNNFQQRPRGINGLECCYGDVIVPRRGTLGQELVK